MNRSPVGTTRGRGRRAAVPALLLGMLLGLCAVVGGSGTTAVAAPYPGTVTTTLGLRTYGVIGRDERPELRVALRTQGNAEPRGPLVITYARRDGAVERRMERFYDGTPTVYSFAPLRKSGGFVVTASFTPRKKSVYTPSGSSARQYVDKS